LNTIINHAGNINSSTDMAGGTSADNQRPPSVDNQGESSVDETVRNLIPESPSRSIVDKYFLKNRNNNPGQITS
ncbi:hypothetical protein ACR2XK_26580, partial [Klebsiella pneumoniae]